MNILITGGAGYIGSHAVKKLSQSGHKVIVVDDLRKGHAEAIRKLGLDTNFIEGNIADSSVLKKAFAQAPIDAVMHFAAMAEVAESVSHPEKYYANNFSATLTLLRTLLENGVKKFIFSSTAATYGVPQQTPMSEDHFQNPINPYGRSKLMVEWALKDLHKSESLSFAILRYFNVAGASPEGLIGEDHEPETHLVPNILLSLLRGKEKPLQIFGNDYPTSDGTCVRDYVHVEDLIDAHILALENLKEGDAEVYNLGSEKGFSVMEVLKAAEKVTGKKIPYEIKGRRAGDPPALIASSDKIKQELGWKPQYPDMETIIAHAWNWHQKNPQGYKS